MIALTVMFGLGMLLMAVHADIILRRLDAQRAVADELESAAYWAMVRAA